MATDRHQAPSYPLRMPDAIKAKVQEAADASGRSLHAELLHRIQRSFEVDEEGKQSEMLLEMRRTQLHLELNSMRQELGQLFVEAKSIQAQVEVAPDQKAVSELEKSMEQISLRKKVIDRRSAEVLSRLAELEAFDGGAKPKA